MPAAWVGAAAAVAGTIGSLASSGGGAAKAQGISQATQQEARTDYAPYQAAGSAATTQSADLLGLNGADAAARAMSTFQTSPGYGYSVEQGLRAVDAGAASQGILRSGATLKAEQTLGNNLANQEFGNYYNRLYNLSGTGLNATSGLVNALNGQSISQQQTAVSQGANDASIYGNAAKSLTGAVGTAYQNGLFGSPSLTGSAGSYAGGGYNPSELAQINNPYNY